MPKILVTATNFAKLCSAALELLESSGCEVVLNQGTRMYTREEMVAAVGDVDAVIANCEEWDEALFACAPKLKIIARFGVGYDCVDLEAAKRHGVIVTNCPGINSNAVAEMTIALLLNLVRSIVPMNRSLMAGQWNRALSPELTGRTVGVLGFGAIAKKSIRKLMGFDMHVLVYNHSVNEEKTALARSLGAEELTDDLDRVLSRSDFLLIHLPVAANTQRIINRENLAKMKDGVYIVNTARAALIDEEAMAEAMQSGKVAGYATDVYMHEPVVDDSPFFGLENFLGTPHAAGETGENYHNTGLHTAGQVLAVLRGEEPANRLA